MPRPRRHRPIEDDDTSIVSLRASPRTVVAGTTAEVVAGAVGLGRRRMRPATRWDEPTGTFRRSEPLAGRSERLLELSLGPTRLTVSAVRPTGRVGALVVDAEITSLGEAVVRPAKVVGVPVLHLDLVIDGALLPLVVARPHRAAAVRFVERWHRIVATTTP